MKILIPVICLVCFLKISAQTRYSTICLERLLDSLSQYQPNIWQPGIYPINNVLDGKQVEARDNKDSLIFFVGIRLIPDEIKKEYNKLYFDFVERYWLELLLFCKNDLDVSVKLKEDNVDLFIDGNYYGYSHSPTISGLINSLVEEQVAINETDSLYQVVWKNREGKDVVLQFRKRIEQILGMDKRELEYHFFVSLNTYCPLAIIQPESVNSTSLVSSSVPEIFVEKGEIYMIQEMKSDQYWKKADGDRFDLLFDWSYIPESVSNLFTGGQYIENDIILRMKQKYYSSMAQHYECSLGKLTSFMKCEGNIIYVGIDEVGSDKITGVVIYENQEYKYNHALYFTAPYTIFEKRSGYIDATIYTYIPTHNVKNLYYKELKKR